MDSLHNMENTMTDIDYNMVPLWVITGWWAFFMLGMHIQLCVIEGACDVK